MKYLLDTHLLLWAAVGELPQRAEKYILDEANDLYFSPASISEVVIKGSIREDFHINPTLLYRGLISAGYKELPITTRHTLEVEALPLIHKDPFDRILLAQAICENYMFLTADDTIEKYRGPIIHI